MAATTNRRRTRRAACALALAVLVATAVGVAAAADTTSIGVSPGTDSLESGDTTTVDVVVENADGGVGALNATVTLSNPDVASVESVTLHGEPRLSDVTERADGVAVSAALADTDDTGSVTVATVVLRAENPGETAVNVDVRALGDEDGTAYSVAATDRPTLAVTEDEPFHISLDGLPLPTTADEEPADGGDGQDDGDSGDTEDGDAEDGADDGQQTDDPPTDRPTTDQSPEDRSDPPATTPGGQSGSPLFGPVGAVIAVSAVALVALVLYRLW